MRRLQIVALAVETCQHSQVRTKVNGMMCCLYCLLCFTDANGHRNQRKYNVVGMTAGIANIMVGVTLP